MNLLSPEEIAPVQADLNRTLAALRADAYKTSVRGL